MRADFPRQDLLDAQFEWTTADSGAARAGSGLGVSEHMLNGLRWPADKTVITFSFKDDEHPGDPNPGDDSGGSAFWRPHEVIRDAMDVWEEACGVRFVEADDSGSLNVDVRIAWMEAGSTPAVGSDGEDGVPGLTWSVEDPLREGEPLVLTLTLDPEALGSETAFFDVVLHELGHLLGIGPSDVDGSVMSEDLPPGGVVKFGRDTLTADDVAAARALWGPPKRAELSEPEPMSSDDAGALPPVAALEVDAAPGPEPMSELVPAPPPPVAASEHDAVPGPMLVSWDPHPRWIEHPDIPPEVVDTFIVPPPVIVIDHLPPTTAPLTAPARSIEAAPEPTSELVPAPAPPVAALEHDVVRGDPSWEVVDWERHPDIPPTFVTVPAPDESAPVMAMPAVVVPGEVVTVPGEENDFVL